MKRRLARTEQFHYNKDMQTQTFTSHTTEETRDFGQSLASSFHPGLVAFWGDLGAGKTTLIQGVLEGFGAKPPFVSPTFTIMKLYELDAPTPTGIKRLYHADAYRVGAKDFENLGFTEWATDPEGLVLLEWPERIDGLLPDKRIDIVLTAENPTERYIEVKR